MAIAQILLSRLKDKNILPAAGLIGDKWIDRASDGATFEVINPSTGEHLATLPDFGVVEAKAAIAAADAAQPAYAALTGKQRATLMGKFQALITENLEDLAIILTAEMGKPIGEARGEVGFSALYVEWSKEEAKRVYGDTIPGHEPDKRIIILKQPVGVVAAITPWNFPSSMLARKLAPALATGCAMISKPAEQTPLSALALVRLAERAGIPAGIVGILPSTRAPEIGLEFCTNETVKKISFTGSTQVGRILMRQASAQIKRLSMELGGNAPFIVFDDADLDAAVEGAMISKFRNNGQTCVCANRLYVQAGVYDAFAEKLSVAVNKLVVGDGFGEGVTTGPLIDQAAVQKVEAHLADAVGKGGKITLGGHPKGGQFFEPTILTGATQQMLISREETFGPVAPLFKFDSVDEVIGMANATEFGLAAYFYAKDLSRVFKVAEALDYGMVGVNTGLITTEVAPFGGVKQSGFGREGSKYGIEDYLDIKYLCLSV